MAEFTAQQGKSYRAEISLGFLERLASNEMIAARLREAGFSDVHVSGRGALARTGYDRNDADADCIYLRTPTRPS